MDIETAKEIVEKYAHIDDATIEKDIEDTVQEAYDLGQVQKAEKILAQHHLDPNERAMAQFKADARPLQIQKRTDFITRLRKIQEARRVVRG